MKGLISMMKSIKRFVVTITLLSLICSVFVSAYATEDTPTDYAALFAKAETVDGHSAEAYFYEMNQLFDSDPEAFVLALSKETFKTIETQAFYLAAEHDYSGMDAYETVLKDIGQKHPNEQAVQDTLYLMRMNILYIKNRPNVINPNYFQENYHETVQHNLILFHWGPDVCLQRTFAYTFYKNIVVCLLEYHILLWILSHRKSRFFIHKFSNTQS